MRGAERVNANGSRLQSVGAKARQCKWIAIAKRRLGIADV
jgi:hypothetical protein